MDPETCDTAKVKKDHGMVLKAEGVSSHMLGDELLVFCESTQILYSLNASAAAMWLCLESGRSMEETSRVVSETFSIAIEQAISDVEAIVAEWRDAGLMISTEAESAEHGHALADDPNYPVLEPYERDFPENFHTEFRFHLAGTTFRVRCAQEEHERQVRPIVRHLETETQSHDVVLDVMNNETEHVIVRDGLNGGAFPMPEQIGPALGQEALRVAYRRINYLIAIHGAVVHNGSESVILAGPSGIGKSTLTAALIRDGLGYFTDEVAILHRESLRVLPLPAGLRIKEGSWEVMSQLYPDFTELPVFRLADRGRLRYFPPPQGTLPTGYESGLPVRALIFPRYAPGERTDIWPLDRVEALYRVQDAGYEAGDRLDDSRIRELINWICGVNCYEMPVSSLDDAVTIIRGVFR